MYGDSAYPVSSVLLSPFIKTTLTPEEMSSNIAISARECVEWDLPMFYSCGGIKQIREARSYFLDCWCSCTECQLS